MGLRRPPQPSRLRSPTARQLLSSFLVYVSVDTRNKMPRNRQEIHKQNCENRGWERREEKRQQWRWEAAPGPNRGFICCALPVLPSSMVHQSPFCHRSSFPQTAPGAGRGKFGDYGEDYGGFYVLVGPKIRAVRAASSLALQDSGRWIGFQTKRERRRRNVP